MLNFWDIGGQERYIYMTNVYYRNAEFCLIMFDLTDRHSFEACSKWKLDLDLKYKLSDGLLHNSFVLLINLSSNCLKLKVLSVHVC